MTKQVNNMSRKGTMAGLVRAFFCILWIGVGGTAIAAEAPLAEAGEKADWSKVRELLKTKIDPNGAQVDGMTALHWAAYHDDLSTARLLLASGAKAKVENRYGVTPLTLACTNGNGGLVESLLNAGADANTTLKGGETVLMTASRTGRTGPVQLLIDAGAKVDARDKRGQTALIWAAAEGHAGVVELLIKAGADFRTRLKSGFTPMRFAAREGQIRVVQSLLKAGVDPDESNPVETKPGSSGPFGQISPLGLAVENGHFELAMVLVKAGADTNDQRSGYTALHRLSWVRKPNRGDDPDGQPPPTGSGNLTSLQFARQLVKNGANVNARLIKGPSGKGRLNHTGATPFLMASKTADLQFMKVLIESGADPLLANKDGCTPFMAAAGIGTLAPTEEAGTEPEALDAVKYLLTLGADVNTVDKNGETAMHGAAYKSLPKMVQFLADKGAKIEIWNRPDKYGWTPLTIAEGFRPGNFKPSNETIEAIHRVMKAGGVTPPPQTVPLIPGQSGYESKKPEK